MTQQRHKSATNMIGFRLPDSNCRFLSACFQLNDIAYNCEYIWLCGDSFVNFQARLSLERWVL